MNSSFYLGPAKQTVALGTWSEIVSAAAAGVLDETHWVELKEAVPPGAGANLELAKDLASLSLDGGTLLIGLTDPKQGPVKVVGAEIEGLETRISQVASGRIHPPLVLTTTTVSHPDDPGKAVLVVSVPASLTAPHMVDDRYWGRGNEGKQRLSDPQVRMVLTERDHRREGFDERFARSRAELNPFDPSTRKNSHLYLLLEPARSGAGPTVRDVLDDAKIQLHFMNAADGGSQAPPTTWFLQWITAHPEGTLLKTHPEVGEQDGTLQVLVGDDGAIAAFSSRASCEELIIPAHVATLTHAMIVASGRLAQDHLGFNGQWQVGVLIDGLEERRGRFDNFDGVRYPQAEYRRAITTTCADMADRPAAVTSKLLAGFFRGMRRPESYEKLSDLTQAPWAL